jgi:hypothetical protein
LHAGADGASYEVSQPFVGVRHFHRVTTLPRLVDIHILEIDPTAPGIDFLVTPSNGAAPGETVRQTTRDFLTQHGAQMAINGSFFAFVSGSNYDIQGLSASEGDVYSPFQTDRTVALNISPANIATIIQSTLGHGTAHAPPTTLFNAVGGNERLIIDGVITAADTSVHPRTAAGVTAGGKLLLMTVDGRNPGHSEGLRTTEMAAILQQFGAFNAINLDGGGSTTMVFADPAPRVVNIPVGVGNVPGSERLNGNNLAVFAQAPAQPVNSRYLFADFTDADEGHFGYTPSYSGSTEGILPTSTAVAASTGGVDNRGVQRLMIHDDPATSGGAENSNGWFARHLSGHPGADSVASRGSNEIRPAVGVIGVWAKTASPGIEISLAIDNTGDVTADRGVPRALVADNQWHRYEWNLEDDEQWEGWFQGDGAVDSPDFTLDSIHLFGPNADAIVLVDDIYHETIPDLAATSGDFDRNQRVDTADYAVWRNTLGSFGDGLAADADRNGRIEAADYDVWRRNFGRVLNGVGDSIEAGSTIPEPRSMFLIVGLSLAPRPRVTALRRSSRRRTVAC